MIQQLLAITVIILTLTTSAYSASISERLIELDKDFLVLVEQTDTCIQSMKSSGKDPKYVDDCRSTLKLQREDINRLKQKLHKQIDRYKERKVKLSEEERLLTEEYIFKIKDKVKSLRNNIKIIFNKRTV